MTPLINQIKSIKEKYGEGTLLLFRVGDFYESMGGDAKIIGEALNLPITESSHSEEVTYLCGFPAKDLDKNLIILVKENKFRVGIVEQLEDTDKIKEPVKRNIDGLHRQN